FRQWAENYLHLATEQVSRCRSPAPIRNVSQVHAGHHLEDFTKDVLRRAVAGRRHINLTRIGLGIGDELRNGPGWDRRMNDSRMRGPHDGDDGRVVGDKIKSEIWIGCGVWAFRGCNL